MYNILNHAHSGLRYIVLALLILVTIQSIRAVIAKSTNYESLLKLSHVAVYAFYINVLLGLVLYFMSSKVVFGPETMKETLYRFFTMEHPLMILISLAIIRMGMYRFKRLQSLKGNRILMITTIIGLIVLLAAIPWPMRSALIVGWF